MGLHMLEENLREKDFQNEKLETKMGDLVLKVKHLEYTFQESMEKYMRIDLETEEKEGHQTKIISCIKKEPSDPEDIGDGSEEEEYGEKMATLIKTEMKKEIGTENELFIEKEPSDLQTNNMMDYKESQTGNVCLELNSIEQMEEHMKEKQRIQNLKEGYAENDVKNDSCDYSGANKDNDKLEEGNKEKDESFIKTEVKVEKPSQKTNLRI